MFEKKLIFGIHFIVCQYLLRRKDCFFSVKLRRKFTRDLALSYRYRLVEKSLASQVLQIDAFAKVRTRSVSTYHYPSKKLVFD